MNPFPYTFDNKRYHTLAYHNLVQNCKTQKAVIDAGLSCPNIDGTCGVGGCIFCDGGSGYFTQDKALSVTEQLQAENVRIHKKSPESKIIAYFQTHTNTYAPVEKLRTLYEEALAFGVYTPGLHRGGCFVAFKRIERQNAPHRGTGPAKQ